MADLSHLSSTESQLLKILKKCTKKSYFITKFQHDLLSFVLNLNKKSDLIEPGC